MDSAQTTLFPVSLEIIEIQEDTKTMFNVILFFIVFLILPSDSAIFTLEVSDLIVDRKP